MARIQALGFKDRVARKLEVDFIVTVATPLIQRAVVPGHTHRSRPRTINLYTVNNAVFDTDKITVVKDRDNTTGFNVPLTVPHDLNRADVRILKALGDGARNPSWLADELDYTRQYVHQRLQLLVAAEYVENIGHGLYELVKVPDDVAEDMPAESEES